MYRLLLIALLLLPRLALAQGVCDQNGPSAQFLDPGAQAQRQKNHDWITKARTAMPNGWNAARLDQLLLPGSHDAGSFGATFEKPVGTSDRWGQTHTYSLLDQLCQGSRWFDVRFKKVGNEFRIFHNTHVFGTASDVLTQVHRFVADPAHAGEVVFLRFKTHGGETVDERRTLFQVWSNQLAPWLVQNPRDGTLFGQLTLGSLANRPVNARPGARVFLLDYDPPIPQGDTALRKAFWFYPDNQAGTFSDKVAPAAMITKQTEGLREWKANKANKMFGLWWTSTGTVGALDVKNNTKALWPERANTAKAPLEEFFKANGCEVGNFLIVDFYGDLPLLRTQDNLVLALVEQYNLAKLHNQKHPLCQ